MVGARPSPARGPLVAQPSAGAEADDPAPVLHVARAGADGPRTAEEHAAGDAGEEQHHHDQQLDREGDNGDHDRREEEDDEDHDADDGEDREGVVDPVDPEIEPASASATVRDGDVAAARVVQACGPATTGGRPSTASRPVR